ncbi:hypothetical protein F11_04220 [Rhodospirillum rubrum F11]|nr:hypothetical protein F11_04220 [Rhodospirillum rubrum F11]
MDGLEGYITALRDRCAVLPDRRTGSNGRYTMADIGLAAFSMFFMQSPSFLAHQRSLAEGPGRGRSNAHTLFGMTALPSQSNRFRLTAVLLSKRCGFLIPARLLGFGGRPWRRVRCWITFRR